VSELASEPGRQILEMVVLDVRAGEAEAFEAAFRTAEPLIAGSPGHVGHVLKHCVEDDHRYLLLVEWERLEDHTEGFRGSPAYSEWKALLHHFYDPAPVVQHYAATQNLIPDRMGRDSV